VIASTSEEIVANGSGDKGLAFPGDGSSTASGSFAGGVTATVYSTDTGSKLTKACTSAKGLASLKLTGTFTTTPPVPASWPQFHYSPDRTGYQPNETQIGVGNVASLSQARTYQTNGSPSAPLIANGILYVVTNQLYAFDATGSTNCSAAPTTCTPLWTAPAADFDGMASANGDVFVTDAEGVQAYDAAGSTDCSGAPKTCTPLWATSTYDDTGPGFLPGSGSPVVDNGALYVPGYGDGRVPSLGGAYVAAFDAAGSDGCTVYNGFGNICVPMWTTTGLPISSANSGSPAIADGVLYIANGTLFAFDAAGSTDCSGTPAVCSPLWTAATSSGPTNSAPAVAYGKVYVGTFYGPTDVFDAAGSEGCTVTGDTKTCVPLWTDASGGTGGTPAVANGVVYTVSNDGPLSAFDADGSTDCSVSGSTKTCTPLWASASGMGGTDSSPAVANGVVYFSSTNGGTYGYDASGTANCTVTGTTTTCAPLWGAVSGKSGGGSPAIVDGVVYINVPGNGEVYAYSL
jgi:hypothetical protein